MKIPRRKFLHLAAGAAALPALPRAASALDYPTRPVRIVVGVPPGTGADIDARLIAQWLSFSVLFAKDPGKMERMSIWKSQFSLNVET